LLGQKYTQKSDIYSLGLVLWEILAARTTKFYGCGTMDGRYDPNNCGVSGHQQYSSSSSVGNSSRSPSRSTSRSISRILSTASPSASFNMLLSGSALDTPTVTGGSSLNPRGACNSTPYSECRSQFEIKEKVCFFVWLC
jgi:hypothetical protein